MRIGLLTLPLETGYGSILQAYALKTVLTRQGHEVILIRRLVKKKRFNGWNILKRSVKKYIFRKPTCVFYDKKIYDEYPVITQHTQPFIDKWLQPFSPVYYNSSAYKSIRDLKCDAYIVGSDQVWRKGCMEEIKDYYFSPIDGRTAKLIAYAASFGIDKWAYSKKETRFCTQKLKEFTAVSVREDSGMELCKRHLNHTAEHVLDPTMLLTPTDYRALIGEGGAEKYANKITAFILDRSDDKLAALKKVSKVLAMDYNFAATETEDRLAPLEKRIAPSVADWLKAMYYADFIFTDSFHGCVFSILFNKPFVLYVNRNRGVARFESLLKLFKIENRTLSDSNGLESCPIRQSIDWKPINAKLEEMRSKSMCFLENALTARDEQ